MQVYAERSSITDRVQNMFMVSQTSSDQLIMTALFDLLKGNSAGCVTVEIKDKSVQWVVDTKEHT
jgi:hypothetical protein